MKWTKKTTNKEVLRRLNMEEAALVKVLVNNKRKYLRERVENDELFAKAVHGKILGKTSRDRK